MCLVKVWVFRVLSISAIYAGLSGCATMGVAQIIGRQEFITPRPVKFQNQSDGSRMATATLIGYREGFRLVGLWKLDGADVWFRETSGGSPLVFGNQRDSILAGLPDSSGWHPGKGETMDLLLVTESDSMPGYALSDSTRYRLALVLNSAAPEWPPSKVVAWKNGKPGVLGVTWKYRRDFNPGVVSNLLYVPAVAADLALSPIYLGFAALMLLSCAGSAGSCFK
jgi:hypothetical protein